jgi:outer membrane lipoprotein SlyB
MRGVGLPRQAAFIAVCSLLLLGGCVTSGQSRYNYDEVGRATAVHFGTVLAVRNIDITGKNTGTGALVGGTTGGLVGTQIGQGNGGIAGVVGGVVLGAIAGAVAEQALANHSGLEYTIILENGKVVTVAQEQDKDDRVFKNGDRVMVQSGGSYQRVLPADNLPTEVDRPKGIKIRENS